MQEPNFMYENGETVCVLTDDQGRIHIGTASCHPNDEDMMSEKTGCEIAYRRARIKVIKSWRDDLKIRLGALKQLYYSMDRSKYFNPKSYENRMLQRQIQMIELDLATAKEMIVDESQSLRDLIQKKEEFYQQIRANRKKRAGSDNSN